MSYKTNIPLFYFYKFLSSLFFLGPTIILFFLETVNYTQLGVVMGIAMLSTIIFEVPSGIWADLLGRKKIIILGVIIGCFELALLFFYQSFMAFVLSAFLGGLARATISGADTSLLYDSLKKLGREKQSKKIYGRARAIRYTAIVLASLVGAPLFTIASNLPIGVTLLAIFSAIIPVIFLKDTVTTKKALTFQKQNKQLHNSLKTFIQNAKLRWYITLTILSGIFIWIYHDLFRSPYYVSLGVPIEFLGIIAAVITIIRIIFSLNAEVIENKLGAKFTQRMLFWGPGLLFIALTFIKSQVALLLIIIIYCFWSIQEVLTEVYIHENIASKYRATILSVNSLCNSLALLIGGLGFGFLADNFGIPMVLFSLGVLIITSGLFLEYKRPVSNHQ